MSFDCQLYRYNAIVGARLELSHTEHYPNYPYEPHYKVCDEDAHSIVHLQNALKTALLTLAMSEYEDALSPAYYGSSGT